MSDEVLEDYEVKRYYDEETGYRIREHWFIDGHLHRTGGPAVRIFNRYDGVVNREEYWRNGMRHRDDGPAIVTRDKDSGSIIEAAYYIDGENRKPPKGPLLK